MRRLPRSFRLVSTPRGLFNMIHTRRFEKDEPPIHLDAIRAGIHSRAEFGNDLSVYPAPAPEP